MKIGILQTGHSPDNMKEAMGDYGQMFEKLLDNRGFTFQIWSVVDNEFPASAMDADGWLITGSKFGAYEDHDWIAPLEELIRAIRETGKPLVGVCFGQDQVTALPADAKVVGSSEFCANAALLYDDNIWTIQPHPEFGHDFIDGLIRTRGRGVVPDRQLDAAAALLDAPTDNAKIADHIADFFKKERS